MQVVADAPLLFRGGVQDLALQPPPLYGAPVVVCSPRHYECQPLLGGGGPRRVIAAERPAGQPDPRRVHVGTDAELNSRLWDVAPDGGVTLVTRGVYRWTGSPGTASVSYALLGSGWVFQAGHQVRIEVTQNDAPYMRLDNYASAVQYASINLVLPATSAPAC